MMNKNDQQYMAQKIRAQYVEKQTGEIDQLRALDAKVKRPANVFGYVFGSISAIIMGAGMSLIMTDVGEMLGMQNTLTPGIVIGLVGMAMALLTYPIYKGILGSRKKKYGAQILKISEQIMGDK